MSLLLGTGVATLWRAAAPTAAGARRYARRALLGAAGVLTFAYVLLPASYDYVASHTGRAVVPAPHLGAPHEDVAFTTSDGLELRGWYVPSRNGAAVIAFPGRSGPQPQARMLIRHGYGVLLFDRRGEGESEGDPNSWGWGGDRDLHAAIAFLQDRPDVEPGRIGGIGLSVGGELMIETAAEHGGLAAVASEGAGMRSVRELTVMPAPLIPKLALGPYKAVSTLATAVYTGQAPPPNLRDLVADVRAPLLLMYSPTGQGGEIELNPEFHRRAPGSELWAIDGAGTRRRQPGPARGLRTADRRVLRRRAAQGSSQRSMSRRAIAIRGGSRSDVASGSAGSGLPPQPSMSSSAAAATSVRSNQRTSWISSSCGRASPPVHGASNPSMSEAGNGHGCDAT